MPTEPSYHMTLELREPILWIQVTEGKTEDLWELSLPAKAEAGKMQSWTSDPFIVQSGKRSQYLGPT